MSGSRSVYICRQFLHVFAAKTSETYQNEVFPLYILHGPNQITIVSTMLVQSQQVIYVIFPILVLPSIGDHMMEMTCFFSQSGPTTSSHSTTHEERRCSHRFPAALALSGHSSSGSDSFFFVEDPKTREREDSSLISWGPKNQALIFQFPIYLEPSSQLPKYQVTRPLVPFFYGELEDEGGES